MGSGKGKTRRVKSMSPGALTPKNLVASTTPEMKKAAAKDALKWGEFVQTSGAQKVKLSQYYLDKDSTNLTYSEYEQLMTELFADMAACGAATLPSPYDAQDIIFKMADNNEHDGHVRDYMTVALRSKPEITIALFIPRYRLDRKSVF